MDEDEAAPGPTREDALEALYAAAREWRRGRDVLRGAELVGDEGLLRGARDSLVVREGWLLAALAAVEAADDADDDDG